MHKLAYYDRQKEEWKEDELQALRTKYEVNQMTISQIADLHRRRPGSISYQLKGLGIITHNSQARGYLEYVNSDLYNAIVDPDNKGTEYEKGVQKPDKIIDANSLARMGKKWDDEEILKLLTSIQKKKSIGDIAKEHQRTPSAINAERKKLAVDYWFNEKRPIEQISKFTGLTKGEIEFAIQRREESIKQKKGRLSETKQESSETVEAPPQPSEPPEDMKLVISLLKDIQRTLSILADRLQ